MSTPALRTAEAALVWMVNNLKTGSKAVEKKLAQFLSKAYENIAKGRLEEAVISLLSAYDLAQKKKLLPAKIKPLGHFDRLSLQMARETLKRSGTGLTLKDVSGPENRRFDGTKRGQRGQRGGALTPVQIGLIAGGTVTALTIAGLIAWGLNRRRQRGLAETLAQIPEYPQVHLPPGRTYAPLPGDQRVRKTYGLAPAAINVPRTYGLAPTSQGVRTYGLTDPSTGQYQPIPVFSQKDARTYNPLTRAAAAYKTQANRQRIPTAYGQIPPDPARMAQALRRPLPAVPSN